MRKYLNLPANLATCCTRALAAQYTIQHQPEMKHSSEGAKETEALEFAVQTYNCGAAIVLNLFQSYRVTVGTHQQVGASAGQLLTRSAVISRRRFAMKF
jgi:hypothetical protein